MLEGLIGIVFGMLIKEFSAILPIHLNDVEHNNKYINKIIQDMENMEDILKVENIPATKIAIESRIVTRLVHITNIIELAEVAEPYKGNIKDEINKISRLLDKLIKI